MAWLNFGGYRKWTSIPMEIFLLFAIPVARKQESFGWLDGAIVFVSLFFFAAWLLAIPYTVLAT